MHSPGWHFTVSFQQSSSNSGPRAGPVKYRHASEFGHVEGLPLKNLNVHQMEVHRVGIRRQIEDPPNLPGPVVGLSSVTGSV